jgi:IS605 OrfB family transposase
MELIRTIKVKLNQPKSMFEPTIQAYTKAYNFVCQTGYDSKDLNGVSLHHKTYHITREYLSADLAISARVKATESLKSWKALKKNAEKTNAKRTQYNQNHPNKSKKLLKIPRCPQSSNCSIRYNDKTFTTWFDKNLISIQTLEGRQKFTISVPKYFQQYLTWRRQSAELFITKTGEVFIHITFKQDVKEVAPNGKYIGIDRGVNKIAVCSDNRFFGGSHIQQISNKYEQLRSRLQSVNTKSAKRHLKKISKKENRFRADVNHCISKKIVSTIEKGTTILLEDLTGIRDSSTKFRKEQRKQIHKWNFYQLEQFLTYKSASKGILVEHIDARYTSQRCSKCGHIEKANRPYQSVFKCRSCHFSLNADLNASRNIICKYLDSISYLSRADVNQPIVAPNLN